MARPPLDPRSEHVTEPIPDTTYALLQNLFAIREMKHLARDLNVGEKGEYGITEEEDKDLCSFLRLVESRLEALTGVAREGG